MYALVRDVATRWNSFDDAIERALLLRGAIDEFCQKEQDQYILALTLTPSTPRPSIVDDKLEPDDWSVLVEYHKILAPFKAATLALQGHIDSRGLWMVLPKMESLLLHLERERELHYPHNKQLDEPPTRPSQKQQKQRPTRSKRSENSLRSSNEQTQDWVEQTSTQPQLSSEHHFSTNINLGWQKLNEYYSLLENSPVYIAALVLHPAIKWRYLEKKWNYRPDWLKKAHSDLNGLWLDYKSRPSLDQIPSPAKIGRVGRQPSRVSGLFEGVDDDYPDEALSIDHLAEYLAERNSDSGLEPDQSPISYWVARQKRWPQLSLLALDTFSVPAMSDAPERVFSSTGDVVSPRRKRLKDETIEVIMCLKSWQASGVMKIDATMFKELPFDQDH